MRRPGLLDRPLPRRVSTQAWMMVFFGTAIGLITAVVGLYAYFVMRGDVAAAARGTMVEQAERLAVQLEAQADARARLDVAEQIATLTRTDVEIATADGVLGAWGPSADGDPDAETFFQHPDVVEARARGTGYLVRPASDGTTRHYVTLAREGSGLLVRLGGPVPPLLTAIHRMQRLLAIAMLVALLVALAGAWLAARQVAGPLKALTRDAQRINEGEYDRRITVRTRAREFQDLARSLNQMAARFRSDITELQRMQRVQNEFIGNVSHEVKNPIFAVFGYLEALGSDTLSPDMRKKYAQKGLANLQRLNSLFSDLIEIARLEYREDLIRPTRFDLQALIEEIGETLDERAAEKGLALDYRNPPLHVVADRNRIRQVITNLVDNAIAYSDEGSVACRMRRHVDHARVEVVDTGRGIPAEHLDRIFERFYRVDTARSRKVGGTGLGLAIVKQILEAHDVAIHVESTAGRGTRFWFDLPLAPEPHGDGATTEPRPEGVQASLL